MSVPTYFGSASVPADAVAAVNATGTLTITPPGSMLAGQLVVVICQSRVSNTWSVGVTGGQTWNALNAFTATNVFCRIFWCTFNGTWAANPRFDSTSSTCTSAVMHVFQPDATTKIWDLDAALATNTFAAPTTPFTVTRTGRTTTAPDCVTLAIWATPDDCSWTSLSGTGWVVTGTAQYRNTSSTDQSLSFAHHLDAAPAAVPNVSKNQTTVTGAAGITAILTFYAYADTVDLTNGLQLYVKMDEGSSGNRADSSGNSRTAVQTGTVASVAGKYTNACDFNSASNFLTVAHAAAINGAQDFTIAFWIYIDADVPHNVLIKGSGTIDYQFQYAGAQMNFINNATSVGVGSSFNLATWYHVLVTYKHAAGSIALYVNNGTPVTGIGIGTSTANNLLLGTDGTGTMDGRVCELCFWNRRVTPSERAAVFAGSWFTGGGAALTKDLSDLMTMSDVRSGAAGFARSLPDAMSMSEVLSRLWQFDRSFADALTMNESVAAARVLVRALIDPMTIGENLTTFKALIRAYADALVLSEFLDKQLTMAAYSDDFNRANSSTPGASWNENAAGVDIAGNVLQFVNTGSYSSVIWTSPVAVSCQYQKGTVSWVSGKPCLIGFLFRCSNTSNGTGYKVVFDTDADIVYWENVSNLSTPGTSTGIGSAALAIAPGNTLGVTLELLGNNTILRIWINPTGLPARADNWNGDTTPNLTMTQNPATPRDAGTFIGLLGVPIESGSTLTFDNWFGGGCLESTGVLWTKDLFDTLILSEALAKVAILLRSYADPIVLSEVMVRVATLRRSLADALTMAENLAMSRSLARSYADALILGEALAKNAGKVLADAIPLGEAFAKQLQIVRGLSDPMTVGDAFAKQMQFARSQSDPIVLGETLKKQVNRALADLITMSEALAKLFGRSVSDLITMNDVLTKAFGKNISDHITLGETLGGTNQIGKTLSDPITLSELLTKVFVGLKSFTDQIIIGEAVGRQMIFGRSISNLITMASNAFAQLLAARALADPITLNEALLRQATLKRSLADLMTLSEAIQKTLVLVRNTSDSLTLGDSIFRSMTHRRAAADLISLAEVLATVATYKRATADALSLNETVNRMAAMNRSVSDPITLADVVETRLSIFSPAWGRRPFNIGTGEITCH